MLLDIAARRADFHALHGEGYFQLPTAWDVGGAKRLEALGYAGLATTIASQAWSLGREACDLSRDEVLDHMRRLVDATEIAVNADYGYGFATDAGELVSNVRLAIDTGVAGLSICDRIGDELFPLTQAAARIRACRRAIDASGADVVLVARTDALLIAGANLGAAVERLVALSNAGADVLCLPGLVDLDVIKGVVLAVAPKPLDIQLMKPGITTMELGQIGVRRVSVGDTFAEAAWASFERAAEEFIDYGDLAPKSCTRHDATVQ